MVCIEDNIILDMIHDDDDDDMMSRRILGIVGVYIREVGGMMFLMMT